MDPTSFEFVLTVPGDARLIAVIRAVVAQAASYAKLSTADSESLAQKVADATASAIADNGGQDPPIGFVFQGTPQALHVAVTWSRDGAEQRRELQQRISAQA